ncbi:MAG: heparin lyase I family protein [Maribacter sp.]
MLLILTIAFFYSCANEENLIQEVNPNGGKLIETTVVEPTVPIDSIVNSRECFTDGGTAGNTGFKSWCWEDVTIPEYSGSSGVPFSQGELYIDSECYEKQVTKDGNRLKFSVNPSYPAVPSWCTRDFNMRAEIRTAPWNIRHAKGTEEWFGWSYTFSDQYEVDQDNQWLFFQVHPGMFGVSPHTELMISKRGQFNGHDAGEIYVVNAANGKEYQPTGITPKAGETLNIVIHAIWGDAENGLLQVWINGQKLYDKQVATIYKQYPWGGNAKWGIYKWPWVNESSINKSRKQGIIHLETYMGALRMITRKPRDPEYGKDSYSIVAPD